MNIFEKREIEVLRDLIRYHIAGIDTQPDIFKYIMMDIGDSKEQMEEFLEYIINNKNNINQTDIYEKIDEITGFEGSYDGIEKVILEDLRLPELDEEEYIRAPEIRGLKAGDRIPAETLRKLVERGIIELGYPEGVEVEFIDPEEEE